jgi:hypothetical protein
MLARTRAVLAEHGDYVHLASSMWSAALEWTGGTPKFLTATTESGHAAVKSVTFAASYAMSPSTKGTVSNKAQYKSTRTLRDLK